MSSPEHLLRSQAAHLRRAADDCRDDASTLHRLTTSTEWSGLSAEACWAVVRLHATALHATAHELDVAATMVEAHAEAVGVALAVPEAALGVVGAIVRALP